MSAAAQVVGHLAGGAARDEAGHELAQALVGQPGE